MKALDLMFSKEMSPEDRKKVLEKLAVLYNLFYGNNIIIYTFFDVMYQALLSCGGLHIYTNGVSQQRSSQYGRAGALLYNTPALKSTYIYGAQDMNKPAMTESMHCNGHAILPPLPFLTPTHIFCHFEIQSWN